MKIVCIGHAAYDIVIPMEGYPIENTKNRLNIKIEGGGGPAATAAYLLGKWGCDVSFLGVVGSDQYGNYIKKAYLSSKGFVQRLDMLDPSPENYWSKTLPEIQKNICTLPCYEVQLLEAENNGDKM